MISSKQKDKLKLDWKLHLNTKFPPCFDCDKMVSIDITLPCNDARMCFMWDDWSKGNLNKETFKYATKK